MLLKTFAQLFKHPKSKAFAWDAAGSSTRLTYWQPENSAINSLLGHHLETLHSRARDMVRKNPYASNSIETLVSNAVDTGIKPQSKAKNAEFRKAVQALWLRWSDEAEAMALMIFTVCKPLFAAA